MKRLILLGNGFDLAHDLNTSYNDFMLSYTKDCFSEAAEKGFYEDDFWKIILPEFQLFFFQYKLTLPDFIDYCYGHGYVSNLVYNKPIFVEDQNPINHSAKVELKSALFERLIVKCSKSNWVEIENEFYSFLKELLQRHESEIKLELDGLNNGMKFLILRLSDYLTSIKPEKKNNQYADLFKKSFCGGDNPVEVKSLDINGTMILNFNYTSTVEQYVEIHPYHGAAYKVNHIHGKLNDPDNPIIFGFGDELRMEESKIKGFFQYIKSFWYFKTQNYHDLIRFIDSDEFQVYVMGHSCGLSDRTMLNMIFEHQNCKSIKIFYYDWGTGNDYTNLTEEISRHFRDKATMRMKIVPCSKSEAMPQAQ